MPYGKGQRRRMPKARKVKIDVLECDVPVTDLRGGSVERPLMIKVHEDGESLATCLVFAKDLAGRGGFNA